jgi:hypothetical protein
VCRADCLGWCLSIKLWYKDDRATGTSRLDAFHSVIKHDILKHSWKGVFCDPWAYIIGKTFI